MNVQLRKGSVESYEQLNLFLKSHCSIVLLDHREGNYRLKSSLFLIFSYHVFLL